MAPTSTAFRYICFIREVDTCIGLDGTNPLHKERLHKERFPFRTPAYRAGMLKTDKMKWWRMHGDVEKTDWENNSEQQMMEDEFALMPERYAQRYSNNFPKMADEKGLAKYDLKWLDSNSEETDTSAVTEPTPTNEAGSTIPATPVTESATAESTSINEAGSTMDEKIWDNEDDAFEYDISTPEPLNDQRDRLVTTVQRLWRGYSTRKRVRDDDESKTAHATRLDSSSVDDVAPIQVPADTNDFQTQIPVGDSDSVEDTISIQADESSGSESAAPHTIELMSPGADKTIWAYDNAWVEEVESGNWNDNLLDVMLAYGAQLIPTRVAKVLRDNFYGNVIAPNSAKKWTELTKSCQVLCFPVRQDSYLALVVILKTIPRNLQNKPRVLVFKVFENADAKEADIDAEATMGVDDFTEIIRRFLNEQSKKDRRATPTSQLHRYVGTASTLWAIYTTVLGVLFRAAESRKTNASNIQSLLCDNPGFKSLFEAVEAESDEYRAGILEDLQSIATSADASFTKCVNKTYPNMRQFPRSLLARVGKPNVQTVLRSSNYTSYTLSAAPEKRKRSDNDKKSSPRDDSKRQRTNPTMSPRGSVAITNNRVVDRRFKKRRKNGVTNCPIVEYQLASDEKWYEPICLAKELWINYNHTNPIEIDEFRTSGECRSYKCGPEEDAPYASEHWMNGNGFGEERRKFDSQHERRKQN
ncbi:hypothetical protein PHYBOEH_006482 [Phytophthora boehmeriae]|uniref:Uncharacterized protein n=1 Tax=Phytophthora boehmeriae TaxID=109152 RepID=A0A8T1WFS6_9STRA|nr:hypothetical protein PHYBOEH_006482 [Phytophthora boehmeriae]